ncbi:NERD domain-containing protein [Paraburkholderia monticola]|uniref:NERD domain-containing protein n=1 Tax=Paraburkholderia monticola TaxID=1399968 RepID=UPI0012900FCD|nr:NERD domain-containing protein [Paraburkholderia monticola]
MDREFVSAAPANEDALTRVQGRIYFDTSDRFTLSSEDASGFTSVRVPARVETDRPELDFVLVGPKEARISELKHWSGTAELEDNGTLKSYDKYGGSVKYEKKGFMPQLRLTGSIQTGQIAHLIPAVQRSYTSHAHLTKLVRKSTNHTLNAFAIR